MQRNFKDNELTIKLVYCGPAHSGKTTNLQALHRLAALPSQSRLMTLETENDRTLFFDLLPLHVRLGTSLRLQIQLFTVPGDIMHAGTRRLVLQGADGIVFVADSRRSATRANQTAFRSMRDCMAQEELERLPLVIQFNKRDLPHIRSNQDIDSLAEHGAEPVFKAVATQGVGVVETLTALLQETWHRLDRTHQLQRDCNLAPEHFRSAIHHIFASSPAALACDPK